MDARPCGICGGRFEPRRANSVYCDACRAKHPHPERIAERGASAQVRGNSLDVLLEAERTKDEERAARAELKKLTALETRTQRYLEELHGQLLAYDKPTPLLVRQRKSDLPYHEWVLVVSDWHVGQQTRIEETGGMFFQDTAVTRLQVAELWKALSDIHDIEVKGRRIEKLHVLVLGDIVDGDDMRNSQHRKVDMLLAPQTVAATKILAWLIGQCLTRFATVEVEFVGGNHDRLSRRAGDAGLGELGYEDTAAWLIAEMTRMVLAKDIEAGRLAVKNWSTFFGWKTIAGLKFVFEHGASFRWSAGSYGGIPYYSIANAGARYLQMLGEADFVVMGHGHISMHLPNGQRGHLFMNGALPPSSQYVQSSFKSIRRPSQWLLSLHRRIGLTGSTQLWADHDGILLPGEQWEREEELRALQDMAFPEPCKRRTGRTSHGSSSSIGNGRTR